MTVSTKHKCPTLVTERMRRIRYIESEIVRYVCLGDDEQKKIRDRFHKTKAMGRDGYLASLVEQRRSERAHLTTIGHCQECGYDQGAKDG